ncbi:hypothetical protein Pmani_037261 [Petrolisthes manimaculis]|uniref:Uncharacterized protein n=1 Tax=Petrolisthes manimaculis TaxID=1843537 RepID=A0AAE1TNH2_9EUCA|nr:hypothetical protein Pmani_037261 [Petrolisthes manimaculis]
MAAGGSRVSVSLLSVGLVLLLILMLWWSLISSREEELDLPQCRSSSACGYLQVNAFGVNSRQFCSCGGGGGGGGGGGLGLVGGEGSVGRRIVAFTGTLKMDVAVTMGNQQFKYCGPTPALRLCGRQEPAYTAAYLFTSPPSVLVGERHLLHCLCPPPRTHQRSDTLEEEVLRRGNLSWPLYTPVHC